MSLKKSLIINFSCFSMISLSFGWYIFILFYFILFYFVWDDCPLFICFNSCIWGFWSYFSGSDDLRFSRISTFFPPISIIFNISIWTRKDSLEGFLNGAHLEDEEREDLEIRGSRRLQQEWERGELATWNGLTERGGEEKLIFFRPERCQNINNLYINKK